MQVYRERAQSVEDGLETNEPLSSKWSRQCLYVVYIL